MCRRVLHSIVLAVFLFQSTACTTTLAMYPSEVTPERLSESILVILYTDEGPVELVDVQMEDPFIRGNPPGATIPAGPIIEIHVDDILSVEVKELDGGKTVKTVVGVALGTAAILGLLLALMWSDPSGWDWGKGGDQGIRSAANIPLA